MLTETLVSYAFFFFNENEKICANSRSNVRRSYYRNALGVRSVNPGITSELKVATSTAHIKFCSLFSARWRLLFSKYDGMWVDSRVVKSFKNLETFIYVRSTLVQKVLLQPFIPPESVVKNVSETRAGSWSFKIKRCPRTLLCVVAVID